MSWLSYRGAVMSGQATEEDRSVRAIAATESAVMCPDFEKKRMIPEVLLMKGAILPPGGRAPLLNAHSRTSTNDVIGSAEDLKVVGNELHCRNVFSSTAQDTFTKVKEGHLNSVSIGYGVIDKVYVPPGQTRTVDGRSFAGPVNVVTKWRVHELSVLPIGADEQAKMRGMIGNPFDVVEKPTMRITTRALLMGRGLPAESTDEQAVAWLAQRGMPADGDADAWVDANLEKLPETPATRGGAAPPTFNVEEIANRAAASAAERAAKLAEEAIANRQAAADAARTAFVGQVRALCDLVGGEIPSMATQFVAECKTMDEVHARIQVEKAKRTTEVPFSFRRMEAGPAHRDKHVGAVRAALLTRAMSGLAADDATRNQLLPQAELVAGYEQFENASLLDLATECLHADGFNTRGLTNQQKAMIALGFGENIGIRAEHGGSAYHTTGSFTNLTLDAINKSLLRGYNQVELSYQRIFRKAASVPDFKNINRIRLGEIPNLDVWPTNRPMNQVSIADEKETYAVEAYGNEISFSWKLLVNDDMDALTRIPMMMGAACRRTVNAVCWSVITSNPLLQDGVALFSAATGSRLKSNYTASGAAPSVTQLAVGKNLMRQQVGMNKPGGTASDQILNLTPSKLVVPSALETVAQQLVYSPYDPASNKYNVYNPYKGMEVVVESLLDSNSTTAWYLFADYNQIDTVEITFLQGQEQPVTNRFRDDRTWAQVFQIAQTFAPKAIDFRGLYKDNGQ